MPPSKKHRSPEPQERQRDPERTRRLILDAAEAEFGAHGYAGARVSAIAARAGVNQQLISYYFDGKEGLYEAMSQQWQERRRELTPPGTPLPEQLRRHALEALHNPDGPRLLAWSGLQYTGPDDDPDHASRAQLLGESLEELRELQRSGRLPAEVDPACLLVMLMAAAMATTTLPHVIEGVCGTDPRSPELIEHFADQVAVLARLIGLEP
ncbi:TetR/AcrR family transcriptional regulator [Actinoallomurus vinaceus]|uniref:TetR/AcrR family transcriptional regulator n=1 Tax=Actinoallomurus vinaceus TaxID=1080074 RepID=UPI0031EF81EA